MLMFAPLFAFGTLLGFGDGPARPMQCETFIDFADPSERERWQVVNDGVMGGLSSGQIRFEDGKLHYQGEINTNGGGFSSIRRVIKKGDLAGVEAFRINHKGDGRAYQVTMRSSARWRGRGVSFQAEIPSEAGRSMVYFRDLKAAFRGRAVPNVNFDNDEAVQIGFILADGIDGSFEMSVSSIETCRLSTSADS